MTRRRRVSPWLFGNLDSFLDVITNSLGMLILIATLSAIGSRDVQLKLGTPLIAEAAPRQQRVEFELSANQVMPIDWDSLHLNEVERIASANGIATESREKMCQEFNARKYRSRHHAIHLRNKQRQSAQGPAGFELERVLESTSDAAGEGFTELAQPDSDFRRRLHRAKAQNGWVLFIVRDDSFALLREARRTAQEVGVDSGWEPLSRAGGEISFSSTGALGGQVDR